MARNQNKQVVDNLLSQYGRTFSDELGVNVERNTPANLYQLLCFSILASARISHSKALDAAKSLKKQGWTSADKMLSTTWEKRTKTLNQSGYARYDERTSTMLGQASEYLKEQYGGDLRKLRESSRKNPDQERNDLKKIKGLGDVGVDIFFREAQEAWEELYPFADKKALKAAEKLNLGKTPQDLERYTKSRKDYVRLVDALIRCDLQKGYDDVKVH